MTAIDLYTLPHKPLRAATAQAGVLLGAADPDGLHLLVEPVQAALSELTHHAEHEEEFIDPLLARLLPDHAAEIARQHAALTAAIDGVRRQLDEVVGRGDGGGGAAALLGLYRAFHRMAATNLAHLDHEETVVMPALWVSAPEGALEDLMAAFRAAHPEAAELYRRWPAALSPGERQVVSV
jgi:hypothetical protein